MNQTKFHELRAAICSIGYIKKEVEDNTSLDLINDIVVIGTGFLVDGGFVITNTHVIDALIKECKSTNWTLYFFNDKKNIGKSTILRGLKAVSVQPNPKDPLVSKSRINSGPMDFGLLAPEIPFNSDFFELHGPVKFGNLNSLKVGKDVAICGYLGGNMCLDFNNFNFVRGGPITHFGKISALAPWDIIMYGNNITNILTDISNGGGFSGSPVFCPESCKVFGLHYAGHTEFGLGLSIPLHQKRTADIVLTGKALFKGCTIVPKVTILGDLHESSRKEYEAFLELSD
jgi:S1-C subfamily serine protease